MVYMYINSPFINRIDNTKYNNNNIYIYIIIDNNESYYKPSGCNYKVYYISATTGMVKYIYIQVQY